MKPVNVQTVDARIDRLEHIESGCGLSLNEEFELACLRKLFDLLALAGMEAEPVAYIFKHPAGKLFWALTDESNKGQSDVMPVFTAPQPLTTSERAELENYRNAQQVVPDDVITRLTHEANHVTAWHHMDEHSCKVNRRDLLALVNACRAAMLKGAKS